VQVAKALVEFETLWHQAWLKGIEQQRSGLSAPLLVRHPDSGQLLVNLDKELMQLIRCAGMLESAHGVCNTCLAAAQVAGMNSIARYVLC
jgi:hypothetical protein